MITLSDIAEAFKNASKQERKEFIELILPDFIENGFSKSEDFKTAVDSAIILSDQKILPRLRSVEKTTGIYSFEDFEEHEPTLPEQIKELANRLEHPLTKSTESKKIELPVIPSTTLEHKASALIEHLKEKVRPRNDAVFMNSNEIINFLKCELPEDLRIKEDIRNPRQAKKDILEKAVKLFSDSVQIIRNKSGNKVTGIALKPSVKCRYTDTCQRIELGRMDKNYSKS
jgi:hypothetical protein